MQKRPLGRSGLQIAPFAFGGNVFGWTADEATSFRLLDAFVAEGFNLIDTADMYSTWAPGHQGGESEVVIGRWLKARGGRDRVVIATKVGKLMGSGTKGLKRDYIFKSIEESLRRLQTDYVDLYQSHEDDPTTPLEETAEAFASLVKQGKARALGASNFGPSRLAEAVATSRGLGLPGYESLQPEYNLYHREEFEQGFLPVLQKEGLGSLTYFGLARGFLTGKYRSEADLAKSPRGGSVKQVYFNERGWRILSALDEVARELDQPLAAVALAWVMGRPGVTAAIASATSLEQLGELFRAARLVLPRDAQDRLEQASRA